VYPILGLHHVTATVDGAKEDLDFCLDVLGLRLVKKTVNFDNHFVYHFYYGDECGAPGTIWTTFPYRGRGVRVGKKGAGQIVATSFSVPEESIGFWSERLARHGTAVTDRGSRFGESTLAFDDPSGLHVELVAGGRDPRAPWARSAVDERHAIRGLHSVTMLVKSVERTIELMTRVLGYQVSGETEGRTRLTVDGDAPGKTIDLVHAPDAEAGVNGLGTVHHVAMAIADAASQVALREELLSLGYDVTEIRDRCYFQSIYFREPGGVLFEVATIRPGFTVDEDVASLGRALKLPPWEEPYRAEIERELVTVEH
jgi:glyoxalase family protein